LLSQTYRRLLKSSSIPILNAPQTPRRGALLSQTYRRQLNMLFKALQAAGSSSNSSPLAPFSSEKRRGREEEGKMSLRFFLVRQEG